MSEELFDENGEFIGSDFDEDNSIDDMVKDAFSQRYVVNIKEREKEEQLPQGKTVLPSSITKRLISLGIVVAMVDILFVLATIYRKSDLRFLLIFLFINIFYIGYVMFIRSTVKNDNLVSFAGIITSVDYRGVVGINDYVLVTVVNDKNKTLSFRCNNNKKFAVGNPITFFLNKNEQIDETEDGFVSPFISFQFSISDIKKVNPQTEENKPTADDFI